MTIEPYTPIDESLCTDISDLVKSLARIYDDAVVRYTPIVNDICNRKASEDEVDNLLTWMLDFVRDERMLNLFKKVCRAYIYIYPEVVGFYVMHYHKEFVKSENEDLSENNG